MSESNQGLRIIMIGAHPDDCELKAGGTAAKWAAAGHSVKFLAMTGGDNGHPTNAGGALQQRRREEAAESRRRLGIDEYEVLENHGGELLPTIEARRDVVRRIRDWKADVVITHRPNDYHPDHRYTSMLVQDSAYMVTVPYFASASVALDHNPVFLYFEDDFQRPVPIRPDVVVAVDDVFEKKLASLDAHVSQMYEWMPFMLSRSSGKTVTRPDQPAARHEWLAEIWFSNQPNKAVREAVRKWYGSAAESVKRTEAFEICEYGYQPNEQEIRRLFPFLPSEVKAAAPQG
jgi:LmbE family N-acetylglucosaminyl deacetylase